MRASRRTSRARASPSTWRPVSIHTWPPVSRTLLLGRFGPLTLTNLISCALPDSNSKRVGGVKLKDGTVLDADLVVLGTGASPNTQLLEAAGVKLEEDQSVKVNGFLQLEDHPDVYAVGDIATYPYRDSFTRIEHWNVASNHGRATAEHIAGGESKDPFSKQPIFWSALGSQLRYVGNGKGFDEVFVDGKPEEMDFAAYYAKDGQILASGSMGRDRESPPCSPSMGSFA